MAVLSAQSSVVAAPTNDAGSGLQLDSTGDPDELAEVSAGEDALRPGSREGAREDA